MKPRPWWQYDWISVSAFYGLRPEETIRMYSFMGRLGFSAPGKRVYKIELLLDIKDKMEKEAKSTEPAA